LTIFAAHPPPADAPLEFHNHQPATASRRRSLLRRFLSSSTDLSRLSSLPRPRPAPTLRELINWLVGARTGDRKQKTRSKSQNQPNFTYQAHREFRLFVSRSGPCAQSACNCSATCRISLGSASQPRWDWDQTAARDWHPACPSRWPPWGYALGGGGRDGRETSVNLARNETGLCGYVDPDPSLSPSTRAFAARRHSLCFFRLLIVVKYLARTHALFVFILIGFFCEEGTSTF